MQVLKDWEELPRRMRTPQVRIYYDSLMKKQKSLRLKRLFDVTAAAFLLFLLSPLFLAIALMIRADSPGPVFYRQERVTQYGRRFRIHKFRTMVWGADRDGRLLTVNGDDRITAVGRWLRKYRLDEICQLIDILDGNMTFVGTRPEVPKYVKAYSPEMLATLLLPAGVTSNASIRYKDEARILAESDDTDAAYVEKVLPGKMKYNLQDLRRFGCLRDCGILLKTFGAVLLK